jgi:hypothetical protein
MPVPFEVVASDEQLKVELDRYRDMADNSVDAVLCELGGGVLHFTEVVFPEAEGDRLLVQKFEREPQGRGPHFDLYSPYIDEAFPWVALLNLSGTAGLTTTRLPEDLRAAYFARYDGPSDEAFDARRPLSSFALNAPGAEVRTGKLEAGRGLLLPQREAGPHIVHDIVPVGSAQGVFVKAVVAKAGTIEFLNEKGYVTLDEFTTKSIGGDASPASPALVAPGPPPAPRRRRRCNLD